MPRRLFPTLSALVSPTVLDPSLLVRSELGQSPLSEAVQYPGPVEVDRVVDEAVAIVMARFNISEAKAGSALIASGYRTHRTVGEVAAAVVRSTAAKRDGARNVHPSTFAGHDDANYSEPLRQLQLKPSNLHTTNQGAQ
jgi:hypothetical protein